MLSATNFWMCFAGLIYLVAGIILFRQEIGAARGWDKLIALGGVFIAASLAAFAPEHFSGPEFIQNMVPPWMPARSFWTPFVGCALFAAATSLTVKKLVRLSSTLLGLMFFLFVCMIYLPSALAHPTSRLAWTFVLRELSFAAGAWALAGLHSRASSPQLSQWMILFGRIVIAVAALFFAVQHFLHPDVAPGIPLQKLTPAWVPFSGVLAYLTGTILLVAGIGLVLNKRSRTAATAIGALMTALTVFPYLVILLLAHEPTEINQGINYVADTMLYAGAALALASALPRDFDRVGNKQL
ncbi:MAG: hypothetical protein HYR56_11585 [Acidobacteria bacterium]|nr:hypothetical protein [Acidobacteriota bacterium]MBI3422540.1 hypothetical protein [Acidobacteriota bacterium]